MLFWQGLGDVGEAAVRVSGGEWRNAEEPFLHRVQFTEQPSPVSPQTPWPLSYTAAISTALTFIPLELLTPTNRCHGNHSHLHPAAMGTAQTYTSVPWQPLTPTHRCHGNHSDLHPADVQTAQTYTLPPWLPLTPTHHCRSDMNTTEMATVQAYTQLPCHATTPACILLPWQQRTPLPWQWLKQTLHCRGNSSDLQAVKVTTSLLPSCGPWSHTYSIKAYLFCCHHNKQESCSLIFGALHVPTWLVLPLCSIFSSAVQWHGPPVTCPGPTLSRHPPETPVTAGSFTSWSPVTKA